MIQTSTKPPHTLWEIGKKRLCYGNFNLYDIFYKKKDGTKKRLDLYWVTSCDEYGQEIAIGDIIADNVNTEETFIKKMEKIADSNYNGLEKQKYSKTFLQETNIQAEKALQKVIDGHLERAENIKKALKRYFLINGVL